MKHYFDWAATALPDESVLQVCSSTALEFPGNPSSSHRPGMEAAKRLEQLRSLCSGYIGCEPPQLVFTSGGSESNGIVISSLVWRKGRGSVILPGIEHPSLREYRAWLQELGFTVVTIDAPWGLIRTADLAAALRDDTVAVCFNAVHNVSGAVQPVHELTAAVRKHEARTGRTVHIHVDAVQALGKIPFRVCDYDIDSASFSAHKLSGPRGTGALYVRRPIEPTSRGGEQEQGLRPGTENLPGIAGFHEALSRCVPDVADRRSRAEGLKRLLLEKLSGSREIELLQDPDRMDDYSPYIVLISAAPVPSEVLLRVLSDRGFFLSAGSACSSQTAKKREHVLTSMGFSSTIASGALRISFGGTTTEAEVLALARELAEQTAMLRSMLKPS